VQGSFGKIVAEALNSAGTDESVVISPKPISSVKAWRIEGLKSSKLNEIDIKCGLDYNLKLLWGSHPIMRTDNFCKYKSIKNLKGNHV